VIKTLIVATLLCLSACSPEPKYPMCDYCKVPRQDARVYACRKCGGSHSSCRIEQPLHAMDVRKDKEGLATGFSIKVCPDGAAK
jgi:hypothetical protein